MPVMDLSESSWLGKWARRLTLALDFVGGVIPIFVISKLSWVLESKIMCKILSICKQFQTDTEIRDLVIYHRNYMI